MKKKKIYISGKITGLDNFEDLFNAVEQDLRFNGFAVMNPAKIGAGFSYDEYMAICIPMLQICDVVYMLSNWKDSTGAKIEHQIAELSGKEIIYQ